MTTYYIGIDIGSTCAKTVVLAETEEIALSFVLPTGWSSVDTAEEIRRRFGTADIRINYVGPVIGNHSGPGTVALFFLGNRR